MPDELINNWVELIIENSEMVEITGKLKVIKEDSDDDKFIETALNGNADYIITQDKHLLKLKEYNNIKIIHPKEFITFIK